MFLFPYSLYYAYVLMLCYFCYIAAIVIIGPFFFTKKEKKKIKKFMPQQPQVVTIMAVDWDCFISLYFFKDYKFFKFKFKFIHKFIFCYYLFPF